MVLYCLFIKCCIRLFDSAKSPSLFYNHRMLLKNGVDYSSCKFMFPMLQMLKFIALWHSCFDLFSACFQIVFTCATGNILNACSYARYEDMRKWKTTTNLTGIVMYLFHKLITGLRNVTNVHFPFLCLLTSQGKWCLSS